MTDTDTLGFISGDSHVNEPRHLWRDNLPSHMRSRALQGITAGEDGGWDIVLEGQSVGYLGLPEEERMKIADPEHRYAVMRQEGVAGECIYPTIGLYAWMLPDADEGAASCRIYNEWIASTLGRSPRFRCAGIVPTWRVEDSIREIEWLAENGFASIMLPAVAAPEWNHIQWEPLWAAAEASGMPIVIHQGTGHDMYFYRGLGAGVSNLLATQSMAPRVAALFATSGVLANHPNLHVVFVEYNVGWLAWTMQTLDFYTESFRKYGKTATGKSWINPELPEPPSFYLRRQIHATFQDDPVAIHNIPLTGAAPVIWGSDYPHEEGTYPFSRDTVARLAKGLDDATTAAVFRDTAARLFNFSDEVLTTPV
jgi:predicted TIM-barrel fold metal-dependent hydrolase